MFAENALPSCVLAVLPLTALAAAPGPPTDLTAEFGNGLGTLSWTPGAMAAAPYCVTTIACGASDDASFRDWIPIGGSGAGRANATRLTLAGLNNGVEYAFQVRAANAAGAGGHSHRVWVTPSVVPGAPTGLLAHGAHRKVALKWTALADDGGHPPIRREYRLRAPGDRNFGAWIPIPGSGADGANATAFTATGLTDHIEYTSRVRAVTAAGPSRPSNIARAEPAP